MPATIIKLINIISSCCLVQCTNSHVDINRPLIKQDEGKVIRERCYEISGSRNVERRIVVATTPRLETKLVI